MKKTYSKLKTDRVVVGAESGVMSCSTRVNTTVRVEEYHTYKFEGDGAINDGAAWRIGFEEPENFRD